MKVLVIKTGHCETLAPDPGGAPSLGDVLRTTPVLPALRERYPGARVSWLVAAEAAPLLAGSPLIDELLAWPAADDGGSRSFDVVLNLERDPALCRYAARISARERLGFRAAPAEVHAGSERLAACLEARSAGARGAAPWQRVLVELVGVEWRGQPYQLGYRPRGAVRHDVGLNHATGPKWPAKAMPLRRWRRLAGALEEAGYSVSWQRGQGRLEEYVEWVHSCRVVVSTDSLGLHLGLALDKQVVGLFGPTDPAEIHGYGRWRCVRAPSSGGMDRLCLDEAVAGVRELHPCP